MIAIEPHHRESPDVGQNDQRLNPLLFREIVDNKYDLQAILAAHVQDHPPIDPDNLDESLAALSDALWETSGEYREPHGKDHRWTVYNSKRAKNAGEEEQDAEYTPEERAMISSALRLWSERA